jgi:hypothetical protein
MSTLDPLSVDDIGAEYTATITDDAGAVDLTGATVTWLLWLGATYIAKTATVVSAVAGTVTYTTVAGDLPSAAPNWNQQWRVLGPGTRDLVFPPVPHRQPVYARGTAPV